MPWTPSATTPTHICLLAEVTSTLDPASGTYDAGSDRHYGQQNLTLVAATANQWKGISFQVPNGLEASADYKVVARPVAIEALRYLERHFRAEAVPLERESIALHPVRPGRLARSRTDARIRLSAAASQLCQVLVKTPRELRADQFTALEVVRIPTDPSAKGNGQASLGIVVFGKES